MKAIWARRSSRWSRLRLSSTADDAAPAARCAWTRGVHSHAPMRSSRFAAWTDADVAFFRDALSPGAVLTDPDVTAPHHVDWLRKYRSQSTRQLVLKPTTTSQVAQVLAYCNARKLAVVPQGGNTSLVGGSVPVFDEIVLSTAAMRRVLRFDDVSGVLVCEAGCILEQLDDIVAAHGYAMPLDLGAKGSCQIGGNVSTNAGGLRLLRYGSLRGSVLGLEAVLADGTVVDCLSTMRKDNTGYDLKQLFIGSEGTLGVVTKVAIATPPRPRAVNVAVLGCTTFDAVQRAFVSAKQRLGEVLSAVEFMDRPSLELVLRQFAAQHRDPLASVCPFYLVIETSGSSDVHDVAKLDAYLADVLASGDVVDGTVAQDAVQARRLFQLREDVPLALAARGCVYKYDLSLPLHAFYAIADETRARLAALDAHVVCYGHLGDSNVHLNVSTLAPDAAVAQALEPFVFEFTSRFRGSISAEHGVGVHKPSFLHLSKSAPAIALMQQLKRTMDPNGILNPYKVLPA